MNEQQRRDVIAAFEKLDTDFSNDLRALRDAVFGPEHSEGGDQTSRVLFASPVTGKIETGSNIWGLDWFDATGFAVLYNATGKQCYHTGRDLNRPNYADAGATVYAAADGRVVFQGQVPGWQGRVIIIKHTLEDGAMIWTRYAHIDSDYTFNHDVKRGDAIGSISDYTPKGPSGDHLHFDVARIDLGAHPGDWPGMDLDRLKRDYIDPEQWLKERRK